jgi:CSLREA domain-containing protein
MSLRGFVLPLLVAAMTAMTAVSAVGAATASATTLTVNTTADTSTPQTGQCSLRGAISAVDSPGKPNSGCPAAAFGSNTIVLAAKTYDLQSFVGPELTVASTITKLTIDGAGTGKTIIDATGLGDRMFHVSSGATVQISDLTLNGGHAQAGTTGSPTGANGGAILNDGNLTLNDVGITNSVAGPGAFQPNGNNGDGGAGGSGGAVFNTGSLTLIDSSLTSDLAGSGTDGDLGANGSPNGGPGGNGGAGGSGGGVASTGSVTITASTFRDDGAGDGGAGGIGGPGTSTGTGGDGGAGGAGGSGGAAVALGGSLRVTNSTFASNQAGGGGLGGAGGNATQAGGNGGAGGDGGSGGTILAGASVTGGLQSATLAGNDVGSAGAGGSAGNGSPAGAPGAAGVAGAGGGVAAQATNLSLQNSILAENSGGNCSGTILDGGHDLSFDGSGCPATFAGGDPDLGALQDNGGPTWTIDLQPGSAAIDQIPATGAGCQPTDQRGVKRPGGSECDIGAYEVVSPAALTGPARSARNGAETLSATVTPNSGSAAVSFEYGTGTKLSSVTKTITISGVTAMPIKLKLTKLHAGQRYRYRVVVSTSDGSALGAIKSFPRTTPAAIRSLRVSPGSFHAAGTTVSYIDTQSARAEIQVLKREPGKLQHGRCVAGAGSGPGCTLYRVVKQVGHRDRAGRRERVHLSGRGLVRGSYVLRVTPVLAGAEGKSASVPVRIL